METKGIYPNKFYLLNFSAWNCLADNHLEKLVTEFAKSLPPKLFIHAKQLRIVESVGQGKVYTYHWNSSNPDTSGTEISVHISEVYVLQGLNCMQELFFGKEKVSLLERCPHFGGVLREVFHCIVLLSVCFNVVPL